MLISFTLLAGAFMLLSYRYIIGETRDSVKRNAGYKPVTRTSNSPWPNFRAASAISFRGRVW